MTNFEISNSRFLVIENVSIANEGYYNCTVRNYMEPTGFNGTFGTDSRRIFLDVKYSARIESFCGYNDTGEDWFIVNHGDEIQLKCLIKGDPQPEIHIKRNDEILASVHSGLELQLKKKSSCLEDIGTFTCYAKNELNLEQPSYKTLDVDVKCAPLYPLGYSPKLNVIATSGEDVILTFTVFSNPPPFSALWIFRQDMQHLPRNVTQVYVSNDNMTTDIRISRIKPDEFGEYSVTVHNTLGSISETFFIIAEGPPEKPSHFFVKEELITDTTAVVVWTPSFNGGHLQTFHVSWRQVLTNNWFSADAGTYAINFTIIELIPGTKYEAKMYSSNIRGKSGESDLITFSTIETLTVQSAQIGVAIIFGIVSGVAAMVITAIIVLIVLRRRSKGTSGRFDRGPQFHEMESVYGNLASDPDIPTRFDEEKNMYGNLPANYFSRRTISLDLLRSAVKELKKEPVPFFKEFYSLQIGLKYQADEAVKSHNIDKNRYRDVYPYDASRVILPGDPVEDYINASYIDGYCQEKRYIAAQGPLDNTVSDLWRMIDAENVQVIVMVTNLIEAGTIKCCQYWSDRPVTYGKCCVSLERIEEYADYVVRHIVYCMEGSKSEKMVKQYHYTAWPDTDVPDSALSIVQFWRLVRNSEMSATSPWLIHCSAGIGRTGTFIALDYLHDQGKTEGSVNIPRAVDALREQRISLVQTKEQYLYLHEALAELHDPIGEIYAVEKFVQLYKNSRLHATEDNEFRELCKLLVVCNTEERDTQIKKTPDGALVENLIKSFDRKILPDDTFRPKLTIRRPGENDFINAIFIPTIRQRNKFILTQCPLENTVVDFIRLLWDHAIKNVVVLESEVDKDSCFWPQEDKPIYLGPFVVSLMLTQMKNKWILQTINISLPEKMQHQEVTTYHVTTSTSWEETLTILDLLVLVNNLPGPLVVQCRDGFTKSGLFVTLLCISDRITTDREVAIAETVRIVKQRRHSAVTNVGQYRMCYDVIYERLINKQEKEKVKMEYVNMQFPKYDQ
ncbi:receptor-type tyrosine-protein phosphatase alpha-like [Mya arenaria]|uniref:receptor-type tyrosine-protein phosphatase alpha-like n=1 Tax=Mya arenaria TaxID=6604 RepID=UPI0022E284BE|nr:receptor-type tyrosine-protein phosphatase alpha-like [Mya arenaria]